MGNGENQQTQLTNDETPFAGLTPDRILDAIEAVGLEVNGQVTALNSYENRVYQIGIEDQPPVIAKFYRPGRWSKEQILEEHQFMLDLEQDEVPVVAPLILNNDDTLALYNQYWLALFPMRAGHPLELDNESQLETIGRTLGRLHSTGSRFPFQHRVKFSVDYFGWASRETVLQSEHLPPDLKPSYETASGHLLEKIQQRVEQIPLQNIRLHGDFHPGNILFRDQQPILVDFDDAMTGPAIQDLWMLLSGDRDQQAQQLETVIKGYRLFRDFDPTELYWLESCRSLRILYYCAWLSRRWNDPAFSTAFTWFTSARFWSDHILQLKEQLFALDETILTIDGRIN